MRGFNEWGGYRVGQLVVADTPFRERLGYSFIKKDSVKLPNGITIEQVRGTHVGNYLSTGTLAVAVKHSGDYFNNYVPVTLSGEDEAARLVPFPDLEFGAYTFGRTVDRLDETQTRQIAAGLAIGYAGLITVPIPELVSDDPRRLA